MVQFSKIFFLILFIGCSLSINAEETNISIEDALALDNKEQTMDLDIMINGTSKTQLQNIPITGYLEVYSILGVKVKSINLLKCVGGCYIDLSKGLYILKAGRVTQKIIVR